MLVLVFILLLLGAICFFGATRGVSAILLPLGLLFWILVPLIRTGMAAFR